MKVKRIVILLLIIILNFYSVSYGKYIYTFDENIVKFTRDPNPPICEITYSTTEWTQGEVVATLKANKKIYPPRNFVIDENDPKIATRVFSLNESGTMYVSDYCGNRTLVSYEVKNIDKTAPLISGCNEGDVFSPPVLLEYADDGEIDEIFVDRYSENLSLSFYDTYYDSSYYYGIDKTSDSLTIRVEEHPLNTRSYKYYLNDKLCAVTPETLYSFAGLEAGTEYTIKVEALDKDGNVLDSAESSQKTSYYKSINSTKSSEIFTANFEGLDEKVSYIQYAYWNVNNSNDIKWNDATVQDGKTKIEIEATSVKYYPAYMMHVYLYDADGNVLEVIPFSIDFGTEYTATDSDIDNSKIDVYNLTQKGNYQIIVTDKAGNFTERHIKII